VTVEAGAVGADYSLSAILYNNPYPSRIFFDGTDNFHEYIDTTVPQIVLTNLNTNVTTYIGSGGGGDLQTVTDAGDTTTNQIISQTVGVGKARLDPNGAVEINTGWSSAYLKASNVVSSDCDFEFPDKGPGTETFAMLSDIPSVNLTKFKKVLIAADIIAGGDFSISECPAVSGHHWEIVSQSVKLVGATTPYDGAAVIGIGAASVSKPQFLDSGEILSGGVDIWTNLLGANVISASVINECYVTNKELIVNITAASTVGDGTLTVYGTAILVQD
jgi:hypothetical protein